MHIECSVCGAFFDEDKNSLCPRCQNPVDESIACGGCCGGCGGCGRCPKRQSYEHTKAEPK